jgi:hypothetical protein
VGAPISAPQPTMMPLALQPSRLRPRNSHEGQHGHLDPCRPSSVGRGPPAAGSWLQSPPPDPPAPGHRRPGRGGACGLPANCLVAAGVSGLPLGGRTLGRCPRRRSLACERRWPTLSPADPGARAAPPSARLVARLTQAAIVVPGGDQPATNSRLFQGRRGRQAKDGDHRGHQQPSWYRRPPPLPLPQATTEDRVSRWPARRGNRQGLPARRPQQPMGVLQRRLPPRARL